MKSFLQALNRPAEAFQKGNRFVAWGLVALTILIDSVFAPVLDYYYGIGTHEIDILKMFKITGLGVLSYLLICTAFFSVCKIFGSNVTFAQHIGAWGISYFPTLICAIAVAFTEVFFYIFWNSSIWGILVNIVFVGIFIWKAILYCVYLREFAKLKGWRFFAAFAVMGIIIMIMASLNGYVGLITPIL